MLFSLGDFVSADVHGPKTYTVYRDVLSNDGQTFDHGKFQSLVTKSNNYSKLHEINLSFMRSGQISSIDKKIHTHGFTTKIVFRSEKDYVLYKNETAGVFSDIKSLSSDYKIVRRS